MCWKADRSVRAFPHVHSSCPGIAAQLGTLVNLCSFYSLGLTPLSYCKSGIMLILTSLKAMPASGFSRGRIRSWWPFVGLKAQPRQHLRPALQGSKGMVVRRPMPGPDSFTLCKMLCYICFISYFTSSCFSFAF